MTVKEQAIQLQNKFGGLALEAAKLALSVTPMNHGYEYIHWKNVVGVLEKSQHSFFVCCSVVYQPVINEDGTNGLNIGANTGLYSAPSGGLALELCLEQAMIEYPDYISHLNLSHNIEKFLIHGEK